MSFEPHTKIVFTVGPATENEARLEELIREGADVCRINMAHAGHGWTRSVVARARLAAKRAGRSISVMMDVKGPEIRTGDVAEPLELEIGETVDFTFGQGVADTGPDGVRRIDVNYPSFRHDVNPGDTVLVDNGLLRFEVEEKDGDRVRSRVSMAGTLASRRHINLPGVRVDLPALTKKDEGDINVGIDAGVDFFALSFVRRPEDLGLLRDYVRDRGSSAKIVAKIEDQQAISNLSEIIDASDGLMVARGDLGVECPYENLPGIQTRAIELSIHAGKPVIVATHMLESMIESPAPTRAEVSDIATAVREQADCVMLSGETSVGRHPVECVRVMRRIAARVETEGTQALRKDLPLPGLKSKMLRSAAYLASEIEGSAIVIFTRRGMLAWKMASLRLRDVPIHAFTDNPVLHRQMRLLRGVEPFLMAFQDERPERTIRDAFARLKTDGWARDGASMIVVTNVLAGEKTVDAIQLRRVE